MTSSFDPRITAYFGDAVLSAGFVAVPHLLLRHYNRLGMTSQQAMFVLQLMESTWDLAEPPRTSGELAQRMGVDKRTIRRYSEELAALGLLALYDQFDEHGAQIGNGYDLSPLFARLAELAPEPRPDRASSRRARTAPDGKHAAAETVPTPGQPCPPHPRTTVSAPPPDNRVRPGVDSAIREGMIGRSALNGKKNNNKQKEMLPAVTQANSHAAEARGGYSLRLGCALDGSEVAQSAELLREMGIEQPVRGRIAPSLTPAEVWSLKVLAAARGWSTGLTIAQVYDRDSRCARPAEDLPPVLDELGRVLHALPAAQAGALLDRIVAGVGGGEPADLGDEPRLQAALQAAWPLLRGDARSPRQLVRRISELPASSSPPPEAGELWTRVTERLALELPPAEIVTWIASSRLLKLDNAEATVGTGNIFARDQLETHYRARLEAALGAELGRPASVQVVIE